MTPLCPGLSCREEAVLVLAGDDMTDGAIADRLGVTERAVRRAMERGRRKLGVCSTRAATARVRELARL
jgi:DNA-binding CsgD family transcriptional regulator